MEVGIMLFVEVRIQSNVMVAGDNNFGLKISLLYPFQCLLELGISSLFCEIARMDQYIPCWELERARRRGIVGIRNTNETSSPGLKDHNVAYEINSKVYPKFEVE